MVDQHTLLYTEGQDSAIWQLDITTSHKRQVIKPRRFYDIGVATAP